MSERTLPLLFLNLGGEMLYVLDQRLKAQVGHFFKQTVSRDTVLAFNNLLSWPGLIFRDGIAYWHGA